MATLRVIAVTKFYWPSKAFSEVFLFALYINESTIPIDGRYDEVFM